MNRRGIRNCNVINYKFKIDWIQIFSCRHVTSACQLVQINLVDWYIPSHNLNWIIFIYISGFSEGYYSSRWSIYDPQNKAHRNRCFFTWIFEWNKLVGVGNARTEKPELSYWLSSSIQRINDNLIRVEIFWGLPQIWEREYQRWCLG